MQRPYYSETPMTRIAPLKSFLTAPVFTNTRIPWWLIAALSTVVVYYSSISWEVRKEQMHLQSLLNTQAIELDRQLENLAVLPQVLASDPRLIAALTSAEPDRLRVANALLKNIRLKAEISNAYLMDMSGLTIAANNHDQQSSFVGKNYGFRPYFQKAKQGQHSTQYAVGATTGVAGYFVAHPVLDGEQIVGVLVVKLSLSHLPASWRKQAAGTLVLDQFGVVILATDPMMLFARTEELSDVVALRLSEDHIYPIAPQVQLQVSETHQEVRYDGQDYIVAAQKLRAERWQLLMLSPKKVASTKAILYCAGVLVLMSLVALLIRSYSYQRLLAISEKRNARQLEGLVRARTHELEAAQQALIVESNFAVLGRMSGAINHEINQPLASLRFNLATLRQLTESPDTSAEQLRETIVDCDRTTKRIARVVEALRSIAKPDNASFMPLNYRDVILDVMETIRRERPKMSRFLQWEDKTPDAQIYGNPVLLQQALLNLLYNAFDATLTTDLPLVSIEVATLDGWLEITVNDNGAGIDVDLRDKLFDPFVQGENRTNGLGLGLALTRQISERHHGSLSYRSTKPTGSCFALSLPLVMTATPDNA